LDLRELLRVPVVGAPLAGGPSTAELVAAVSEAGGLGFLAAGYQSAEELERELGRVRVLTSGPFGVNLFFPAREQVDDAAIAAYAERLRGEGERYGVEPGEPRWSDDGWDAKLALVAREHPAVVSFTFGCPDRELVESLHAVGSAVWCTVTSAAEAEAATAAAVDALVVQGSEAGGHQGFFLGDAELPASILALLDRVARITDRPLVAAGGIATGHAVAAVLAAGASAAQAGTAFLLAPEAGTSEPHRAALRSGRPTRFTRAFTGRRARGILNRFMREHDRAAPRGYPQVHFLTAPIRAAARAAGDPEAINLWAGQAYALTREEPAATTVERLAADLKATV
jgi:nitronate monooxygenase